MEEITDMGLIGMKITPAPDYDMNLNDEAAAHDDVKHRSSPHHASA